MKKIKTFLMTLLILTITAFVGINSVVAVEGQFGQSGSSEDIPAGNPCKTGCEPAPSPSDPFLDNNTKVTAGVRITLVDENGNAIRNTHSYDLYLWRYGIWKNDSSFGRTVSFIYNTGTGDRSKNNAKASDLTIAKYGAKLKGLGVVKSSDSNEKTLITYFKQYLEKNYSDKISGNDAYRKYADAIPDVLINTNKKQDDSLQTYFVPFQQWFNNITGNDKKDYKMAQANIEALIYALTNTAGESNADFEKIKSIITAEACQSKDVYILAEPIISISVKKTFDNSRFMFFGTFTDYYNLVKGKRYVYYDPEGKKADVVDVSLSANNGFKKLDLFNSYFTSANYSRNATLKTPFYFFSSTLTNFKGFAVVNKKSWTIDNGTIELINPKKKLGYAVIADWIQPSTMCSCSVEADGKLKGVNGNEITDKIATKDKKFANKYEMFLSPEGENCCSTFADKYDSINIAGNADAEKAVVKYCCSDLDNGYKSGTLTDSQKKLYINYCLCNKDVPNTVPEIKNYCSVDSDIVSKINDPNIEELYCKASVGGETIYVPNKKAGEFKDPGLNNSYCSMYCVENVDITIPKAIVGIIARKFKLVSVETTAGILSHEIIQTREAEKASAPNLNGTRTCKTVIDYTKWNNDYDTNYQKQLAAYNDYQKYYAIVQAGTKNTNVSYLQVNASGSYTTATATPNLYVKNTSEKERDAAKSNYDSALRTISKLKESINQCNTYASGIEYDLASAPSYVYGEVMTDADTGKPVLDVNTIKYGDEAAGVTKNATHSRNREATVSKAYFDSALKFNEKSNKVSFSTYNTSVIDSVYTVKNLSWNEPDVELKTNYPDGAALVEKNKTTLIGGKVYKLYDGASNYTEEYVEWYSHQNTYEGTYETNWKFSKLGHTNRLSQFVKEGTANNAADLSCKITFKDELRTNGSCEGVVLLKYSGSKIQKACTETPGGAKYNFSFKIADPAELFPENTTESDPLYAKNWLENEIGKTVKQAIEGLGDKDQIFAPENLTYSYRITQNDISNIKKYNKEQIKSGGYNDFTLRCTCTGNSCSQCKSVFLEDVVGKAWNSNNSKTLASVRQDW